MRKETPCPEVQPAARSRYEKMGCFNTKMRRTECMDVMQCRNFCIMPLRRMKETRIKLANPDLYREESHANVAWR
jgi:hypothetical protein